MILPFEGDETTGWKPGKPTAFLSTPASETAPMFSEDGRWIAYMSSESGQWEIYVSPFPGADGNWKISTASGSFPVWSAARRELFYLELGPQSPIMVAAYATEGVSFRADKPRRWSPGLIMPSRANRPYDVHPDGLRVAINKPPDTTAQQRDKAIFVFNFFDEIRRVAPGK